MAELCGFDVSEMERATASHIGDGVYASFDGYHIWLRVGRDPTRPMGAEIALEPPVLDALTAYRQRIFNTEET